MKERLEALLRLYQNNEYLLKRNPVDYEIHGEQEILYRKMEECIPVEHCDEINFLVYGISRL